jgi:glycosyltransferase involved in cell wall biosynthesis
VRPISVIIASYNAADTLGDQLEALTSQAWPVGGEIIVADNRSTDDTVGCVARFEDAAVPVRRVQVNDEAGAAYARNAAVHHATHSALAFCDADDVVGPGWVAAMTHALADHDFVGGPLEYERLNPAWLAHARGRLLAPDEPAMFEGTFPIVSSCNMGIDRRLFESMTGFDSVFERVEDAELSMRLWRAGVAARHCADAVVHYRMRTTNREIFVQSRSWGRQIPLLRSRVQASSQRSTAQRIKSWSWLLAAAPRTLSRSGRAHWLHVAGTRIGSVEGRSRVVAAGAGQ